MIKWKPLLEQWSREMLNSTWGQGIARPTAHPYWIGFEPATEAHIAELEAKLGLLLPPSYKDFLLTTNGWSRTGPFIEHIRASNEVDWFRTENEHWVELYSESGSELGDDQYYDYPPDGAPDHRAEHMPSLVQVSDVGDGVCLLNPSAVTPDGEWEAWFFANWVPGAERYPSFAHLIVHQYRFFRESEGIDQPMPELPKLSSPKPTTPRVPAERATKRKSKPVMIETLLAEMQSDDERVRTKAVRTFFGKLKGRPRAERRPKVADELKALFYRSKHVDVRCACVAGLTEMAEDAPSVLLDALSDPDPDVLLQGIFALSYFPDERAVEPLCRFIDSRTNVLFSESAMSQLAQLRDPRAIPTLTRVLYDTTTTFEQSIGSAGLALGRCGPKGVDVLIDALRHENPRVRHAAVVGIDVSDDPRAAHHLDQMADDPDEHVRKRASIRMGGRLWN